MSCSLQNVRFKTCGQQGSSYAQFMEPAKSYRSRQTGQEIYSARVIEDTTDTSLLRLTAQCRTCEMYSRNFQSQPL